MSGPRLYFGSGLRVDPFAFTAADLHPVWLGHAQAGINRFSGNGSRRVNVAAHAKMLSHLVGGCIHRRRAALMHDVPECFTGDVPSPIKRRCPDLLAIDAQIIARIAEVYDIPAWAFDEIHETDRRLADDEKLFMFDDLSPEDRQAAEDNRLGVVVTPLPPEAAAAAWTRRFYQLFPETLS